MKLFVISAGVLAVIAAASIVPGPYSTVIHVTPGGVALLQSAQFDPAAAATIQRACGNCHSNDTEWPLYSRVAPVSWLVRKDVSEGRQFLNFSQWAAYGAEGQGQLLALAAGQVKKGKMPPKRYVLLHPEARLSDRGKSQLVADLERESARVSSSSKFVR